MIMGKIEVGRYNLTERMAQLQKCEKGPGHRWFDTDELYEQCQVCGHMRLQKHDEFSIIHVKKKGVEGK